MAELLRNVGAGLTGGAGPGDRGSGLTPLKRRFEFSGDPSGSVFGAGESLSRAHSLLV